MPQTTTYSSVLDGLQHFGWNDDASVNRTLTTAAGDNASRYCDERRARLLGCTAINWLQIKMAFTVYAPPPTTLGKTADDLEGNIELDGPRCKAQGYLQHKTNCNPRTRPIILCTTKAKRNHTQKRVRKRPKNLTYPVQKHNHVSQHLLFEQRRSWLSIRVRWQPSNPSQKNPPTLTKP
jgi:hypothetical protein